MESLFTDLEHDRRIEVSRLNGGLLLGHILEYLKNPYIHPETGHKVLRSGFRIPLVAVPLIVAQCLSGNH